MIYLLFCFLEINLRTVCRHRWYDYRVDEMRHLVNSRTIIICAMSRDFSFWFFFDLVSWFRGEKDGRWCRCKHLPNRVTVFLFVPSLSSWTFQNCRFIYSKLVSWFLCGFVVVLFNNMFLCLLAWNILFLFLNCCRSCRLQTILAIHFWFYLTNGFWFDCWIVVVNVAWTIPELL